MVGAGGLKMRVKKLERGERKNQQRKRKMKETEEKLTGFLMQKLQGSCFQVFSSSPVFIRSLSCKCLTSSACPSFASAPNNKQLLITAQYTSLNCWSTGKKDATKVRLSLSGYNFF